MSNLRLCTALLFVMAVSAFCQETTPSPAATPAVPSSTGAAASSPAPTPDTPKHVRGTIKPPVLISGPDPQSTDQARAAHFSGSVEVYLWVDEHGNPSHVRVVKGVGMGLDEKAIEAVRQYKFKPAKMNGQPVKVDLNLAVYFQL